MCILFAHNSQIYFFNFFHFVNLVSFYLKLLKSVDDSWAQLSLQFKVNSFETSQMIRSWSEDVHIVCT